VDFVSPKDGGGWENYVKGSLAEGLGEYYKGHTGDDKGEEGPVGIDMVVSGTVPAGAGLSVG
jgi:galactokinase